MLLVLTIINDYYDVGLKYARLAEAGISREDAEAPPGAEPEIRELQVREDGSEDGEGIKRLFREEDFDYVSPSGLHRQG